MPFSDFKGSILWYVPIFCVVIAMLFRVLDTRLIVPVFTSLVAAAVLQDLAVMALEQLGDFQSKRRNEQTRH